MKYFTILHPGVNECFTLKKQEETYQLKEHPYKVAPKQMLKGLLLTLKQKLLCRKEQLDYDYCPFSSQQIEENAQGFIDGWMRQFKIEDMNAPLPEHIIKGRKLRVATLKEMIQFCKDRDFRMYVVLPPVTKALSNKFSSTFRENYIFSFLREAGLPEDQFLNYLDDEDLQKNENFYNSLFLNKKGGLLFTQRVLTDLGIL